MMFKGSVALVTGGGSGIGEALCIDLATRGATVAVVDLDRASAEAVASRIGGRAYDCDVADHDQVRMLAQSVEAELGGARFVFANAGVAIGGTVTETDPREFQWLFDVNVGGVFNMMQAFAPRLQALAARGERTHFVVTGSENSLGLPLTAPSSVYTATKHAVLGLTDALRRDLADSGVGVSIVCPGVVSTLVWDARRARQDRYGGASAMPADYAARASKAMRDHGLTAEGTAADALDGVERGDFMIVTDTRIRRIVEPRHAEIATALDRCDERFARETR